MKQEKASLLVDGQPLHLLISEALKSVCGEVFVSARPNSNFLSSIQLPVLFDEIENIGPASALLAASNQDSLCSWFVVACDFPLIKKETLQTLLEVHTSFNSPPEITCYVHPDGTPEPLLAIWTPSALERLRVNVTKGLQGPRATLQQSRSELVKPLDPRWLVNVNTPEEWESVNASK